jgi:putative lipoic acid-binding regulatory protein
MPTDAEMKAAFDRIEQLLEFPVDFPIKIVGRRVDDFAQQIAEAVQAHVPAFDPSGMEIRASAQGNWLSLTVVVQIESRTQLEALYRALGSHPLVRMVL